MGVPSPASLPRACCLWVVLPLLILGQPAQAGSQENILGRVQEMLPQWNFGGSATGIRLPSVRGAGAGGSQEQAGSAAAAPSSQASPVEPRVIGSRLQTAEDIKRFRDRWACMSSHANYHWQLDPTPRLIPWMSNPHATLMQMMDKLDGFQVNEDFLRGKFAANASAWPVPQYIKYNWAPRAGKEKACGASVPYFDTLDVPRFCSKLRSYGGSLAIIGDSLSEQFAHSLFAELSADGALASELEPTPQCKEFRDAVSSLKPSPLQQRAYLQCSRWMVCGKDKEHGGVELHLLQSCHLKWIDKSLPAGVFTGDPWCPNLGKWYFGEELVRVNASIVVMNRGLHFVGKEKFVPQLNFSINEIRKLLPKALLIYRSSTPGHPNCQNYSEPLDKPLKLSVDAPFNWAKVPEEDKIAKDFIESVGGYFLDLSDMASMRPDGHMGKWLLNPHGDCLHYRLPGVPNAFVRYFAAILNEMI